MLDKAVEEARKPKPKTTPKPQPTPIEELAKKAKDIIDDGNVLARFGNAFAKAYAGERNNAKLLYLIATSRLFSVADTMHAVVKGPSAAGKSAMVTRMLEFMPPEEVVTFTALSERALLYWEGDFNNKILFMGEALDRKSAQLQDYLLRELMSNGRLLYPVPMKVEGEIKTVLIEKNGPVAFIVTTTSNELNPENETRMLSLELSDTSAQTASAMRMIAQVWGLNKSAEDVDFAPWQDYQRWLAAGETRVYIPFAPELADLIPPKAVRVRRDFTQMLAAIKAHALLHREHRERDKGEIVATVEEDYAAVRILMRDILAEAAEVKVREAVLEAVKAVEDIISDKEDNRENCRVTVRAVATKLNIDVQATRRRLSKAIDLGLITNLETRKYMTARYALGELTTKCLEMLPTPEALARAYTAAVASEGKD